MSIRLLWQQIPSPIISEMMAHSKFNGVVLDTEHGCFNNETLYNCIRTIRLNKNDCYVRVTEVNETLVRMCLDAGANGIIFANIERYEQIEVIEKICIYPNRGLGFCKENDYGYKTLMDVNKPIIICQIESDECVARLCEFTKYLFIDYWMIGPYDLSKSLGCPGDFKNSIYTATILDIIGFLGTKKLGIHLVTDEAIFNYEKYKEWGLLAIGLDTRIIMDSIKRWEQLK